MFPLTTVSQMTPQNVSFIKTDFCGLPGSAGGHTVLTYAYGSTSVPPRHLSSVKNLFTRANAVIDRVSLRSVGLYFYF